MVLAVPWLVSSSFALQSDNIGHNKTLRCREVYYGEGRGVLESVEERPPAFVRRGIIFHQTLA